MSPGILLSSSWLGDDTRRHYLRDTLSQLGNTIINIQYHPFAVDKAHVALVSDVDIDGLTINTNSHDEQDHEYVVALIRKTPTTWWEAAELFLARELAVRGRIKIIER